MGSAVHAQVLRERGVKVRAMFSPESTGKPYPNCK